MKINNNMYKIICIFNLIKKNFMFKIKFSSTYKESIYNVQYYKEIHKVLLYFLEEIHYKNLRLKKN